MVYICRVCIRENLTREHFALHSYVEKGSIFAANLDLTSNRQFHAKGAQLQKAAMVGKLFHFFTKFLVTPFLDRAHSPFMRRHTRREWTPLLFGSTRLLMTGRDLSRQATPDAYDKNGLPSFFGLYFASNRFRRILSTLALSERVRVTLQLSG